MSFEGRLVRALPAVSALVIFGLGLVMTVFFLAVFMVIGTAWILLVS